MSIPPGRAGRLRLRHSIDVATRGADLLDQKLRILRTEHERRLRAEEAAGRDWQTRLGDAETWLLRGVLLGGEQALEAASVVEPADVTVEWATSMGVRHPSGATCTPAVRAPTEPAPGNTALLHAEAAYRDALLAAADYAAARAATRIIGAEVLATRRRVRALRRHWIPRLTEQLAATELALEQTEHEDAVRRRWAAEAHTRERLPPDR
ncbi:V-type ATP synthase subunit D [Streptomyces sp. RB6PN25]|uniref:V-type ATP synthase subunit D n=1 Tax=Streptomyces humicola TaxID=2953240 RepID=A0ABT1PSF8_9ACTN|nr:V-type ATP synthase subunit D [Streptomyces humicola]MCQ4080608.1 V-type ATP synthase subunit D [Streptomyces humicola]